MFGAIGIHFVKAVISKGLQIQVFRKKQGGGVAKGGGRQWSSGEKSDL